MEGPVLLDKLISSSHRNSQYFTYPSADPEPSTAWALGPHLDRWGLCLKLRHPACKTGQRWEVKTSLLLHRYLDSHSSEKGPGHCQTMSGVSLQAFWSLLLQASIPKSNHLHNPKSEPLLMALTRACLVRPKKLVITLKVLSTIQIKSCR